MFLSEHIHEIHRVPSSEYNLPLDFASQHEILPPQEGRLRNFLLKVGFCKTSAPETGFCWPTHLGALGLFFKNSFQICSMLIKALTSLVDGDHLYSGLLPPWPLSEKHFTDAHFQLWLTNFIAIALAQPLVFYSGFKSSTFSPTFYSSRGVRVALQSRPCGEKSIVEAIACWFPNRQELRHLHWSQHGCASQVISYASLRTVFSHYGRICVFLKNLTSET